MHNIEEIPKVEIEDFSEFKNKYLPLLKPVILKGAANHWPAMKNWNTDYLVKKIGHVTTHYKESESYIHPVPHDLRKTKSIQSSFSDYITKLQGENAMKYFLSGDETCFISQGNINENLLPIYEDFSLPSCIPENKLDRIGLWISARGVHSWLHYDSGGDCNLNAQIRGSKRAYFFDPNESKNLYMFSAAHGELFNFSKINYIEPDFEKFPLYKNASYITGEIEQGDMLYIPKYWLHAFQHTGDININVNFWWKNETVKFDSLASREDFIKRCMRSFGFDERGSENFGKFTHFLETNKIIQDVVDKLERNFIAEH